MMSILEWFSTATCKYKIEDFDVPKGPQMPLALKQKYLAYVCERQASSYENNLFFFICQVFVSFVILGIAMRLTMPDVWTHNNPNHEQAKLAIAHFVEVICAIAVGLHVRYHADCNEDCSVEKSAADTQWTSNDTLWAFFGALLWFFWTGNVMWNHFNFVKDIVLNIKTISGLMQDFTVIDAPLNTIAFQHTLFFFFAVFSCIVMKQPKFICFLQKIWAYSALLVDFVWIFLWYTPFFAFIITIIHLYDRTFFKCIWNRAQCLAVVRARVATSAAAATGVIANEDNVEALPAIAQYGGLLDVAGNPVHPYTGTREIKQLTKYWQHHMQIISTGHTAKIDDIKEAFVTSGTNIQCDEDGIKWFIWKEVKRLGLNTRVYAKKKK